MQERTKRKVGAKRMWIRRWRQAGRISASEAKTFERHLERTGALLKPKTPAPSTMGALRKASAPAEFYGKAAMPAFPTGPVVTIQYDPSRFRIEFTAIRRGRRPRAKAAHG
ncbi:MAG TPA: hypothetical protein VGR79_08920 [Stellaceae bacterium]|nr:hypothetical protein [Stellaceae bacterium]